MSLSKDSPELAAWKAKHGLSEVNNNNELQLGTWLPENVTRRKYHIEFWVKDGSCHQSVVHIITEANGEQSITNYFQGGGHTWEELEAELARDPKAVPPSRDALLDLLGFVRWCIDNGKSNAMGTCANSQRLSRR